MSATSIALLSLLCIIIYLGVGTLLTVFVFSQFPFVDGGFHFIVLWPIVLFTCFGFLSLVFTAIVFFSMYGLGCLML